MTGTVGTALITPLSHGCINPGSNLVLTRLSAHSHGNESQSNAGVMCVKLPGFDPGRQTGHKGVKDGGL